MKLGNKRPSQFGTAFLLRPRVGSGAVGLSHIVKLEGHESDGLGQLMVGVKGFEPSPSSSRTTRATTGPSISIRMYEREASLV